MFGQASNSIPVRTAAAVTVLSYATLGQVQTPNAVAQFFVLTVAARTAGSITAQLQGSNDGVTYTDAGNQYDLSVSANGQRYIALNGPLPPYLRVALTPAGGFDGTVAVDYYSSSGPLPSVL